MQLLSLIGKKTYQKHGFLQNGTRVPLTGVVVSGNFVTQIKTADKEGYNSLQLGIGTNKKAKKRIVNHGKKAGLENTPRFFREVRVDDIEGARAGAEINVSDVFKAGDMVDVTGVSKGKGWAGVVKRYGFHGGPRTHGQSDRERAPGSIGQTTTPGRVYKGKKMAGRMGQDTVTVKNLEVIEVTSDGVLLIKGLVPGSVNSVVVVKKIGENKKFVPLYKEVKEEKVEEAQQIEESTSRSSVSEDAKQTLEENKSSDAASLSESQPTTSQEAQEVKSAAALNSSEDEQAPSASGTENKESEESTVPTEEEGKEEVKDGSS